MMEPKYFGERTARTQKEATRKTRPPMTLRREASRLVDRAFFDRSPEMVARDLLGKILVHRRAGTRLSDRIIENEAYLGLSDPAFYAYSGKSTAISVLFGPPGVRVHATEEGPPDACRADVIRR
jgi:hypothetical protein